MTRTLLLLSLVPPWMGLLFATLQIHNMDLSLGSHSVCGPWGCGPRTEALIGYHGFWAAMIIPPAVVLGALLPRPTTRILGGVLFVASVIGTVAYVTWDGIQYASSSGSTQYVFQRAFFALVTAVDCPMLQVVFASGLMGAVLGRRRSGTDKASEAQAVEAVPVEHETQSDEKAGSLPQVMEHAPSSVRGG